MERYSIKLSTFASWLHYVPRYREKRFSFDPSVNLENLPSMGESLKAVPAVDYIWYAVLVCTRYIHLRVRADFFILYAWVFQNLLTKNVEEART